MEKLILLPLQLMSFHIVTEITSRGEASTAGISDTGRAKHLEMAAMVDKTVASFRGAIIEGLKNIIELGFFSGNC